MPFQISARRWRPQTFEEVIGQKELIQILTQAVAQKKTAQAYLFTGMRGVGKTTIARILAKALNCTDPQKRPCNACTSCVEITEDRSVDVMQIDGASNTSVDNVRELRELVKYRPIRGPYKVIIIDEAHMLSNSAWNALLKILEEPPSHLVFIFATTEAHKIPATIISRCQQFIFRRLTRSEIEQHLKNVAEANNTPVPDRVLTFISKASEGSLRDALSLFDQAVAYGGLTVTEETLAALFGRVAGTVLHTLLRGIAEKNAYGLLEQARAIEKGGYDLRQFLLDWVEYLRHLLVVKHVPNADPLIDLPEEEKQEIQKEVSLFSKEALHRLFTLFVKLQEEIRNAPRPHILFEVALMKTILLTDLTPLEKIVEQLQGDSRSEPTRSLPMNGTTKINEHPPEPPRFAAPLPNARSGSVSSVTGHDKEDKRSGGGLFPSLSSAEATLSRQSLEETKGTTSREAVQPVKSILTEDDAKPIWGALLDEIQEKNPRLASSLSYGKEEIDITSGVITIRFSKENAFLIPMMQKEEDREWLFDLAKRYFKRAMRIVYQASDRSAIPQAAQEREPHPLVQEVLRVFEGARMIG